MDRFLEFTFRHWALSSTFVLLLAAFLVNEFRLRRFGVPGIGPLQATALMSHEDALVLDVREDREVAQGRLPHAVHIPLGELGRRIGELEPYRGRKIVVYCRSGHRSQRAAMQLRRHGFESVYNLDGGILAWEQANLPVTRGRKRK
ncbi:MAG: rhodanese-like domain-containing protein [Gammaproteobacteria bacterium]|nr:MAG: rhodanese-like domain-containing protein [Gammaproteobacteria bacterium]